MRNIAAKYSPAPAEQVEEERAFQPEWEAALGRTSGIPKLTYTVPTQVNGTSVNVLLMDLQRPKRSDLFVELEASQLTAVLDFLQEDLKDALESETKWKKSKKQRTE